jgi:spermidine/putrescine transport system substrate-binding protein
MTPAQYDFVRAKLKQAIAQSRLVSSEDTALTQGLASGELVAAMSWRIVYSTLHKEGRPVAYMNPPGGMLTFVCGLVMHKDPSDEAKALALIDSSLSDDAAKYMIEHIGDEPANEVALKRVSNATFENLGLTRDVETFLKSGIFERRLTNKEQIVNDWTEIRAGL